MIVYAAGSIDSQRILWYTRIRPLLLLSQRSMKSTFVIPSNSTLLSTDNLYTPPGFPSPPSGSEAKQSSTLLTFPPTGVNRWEGRSDPTGARLHFGIWSLEGD